MRTQNGIDDIVLTLSLSLVAFFVLCNHVCLARNFLAFPTDTWNLSVVFLFALFLCCACLSLC
ncbi:unnamed protein product [Coffea canephora]|uniref:Uncharacterized protein n=1 Tax=Coffea canephora TaxID=49390 RepID=A0A068V6U3_COFCA|nr:unnamed protein product [Coffea canephora]